MTVRDPNYGKYVSTDPSGVKKGDQNKAVIGPARLQDEEEVQQQVDKGIAATQFSTNLAQGNVRLGQLTPDFWHTSKYLSGATANGVYGFTHSGLLYPFFVGQKSYIDALAIYVVDGLAGVDTTKHAMRLGIYNELDGLPYLLLTETEEFNPADGSIADNTFHVEELGAVFTLNPGRYWLARKRKYNSVGSSSGNNASAHTRAMNRGVLEIDSSFIGTTSRYGGINMAWPNDGFTSMPAIFDINDYTPGIPPTPADTARPEIYVRAV